MINQMSDEELNAAVAECCGWREAFPQHKPPHPETKKGGILLPYKWVNEITGQRRQELPNFVESRDAMAGALETLSEQRWIEFTRAVREAGEYGYGEAYAIRIVLTTDPKQLAIAFLKAKGKL